MPLVSNEIQIPICDFFGDSYIRIDTSRLNEQPLIHFESEPTTYCSPINTLDEHIEHIKYEFRNCSDPIGKIRMTKKILKIRNELDALITWG